MAVRCARRLVTFCTLGWLVGGAAALVVGSPRAVSLPRASPVTMAASRRTVLPLALGSLLGGRIAFLVTNKEEYSPPAKPAWDPEAAIEASRAAGACPTQSCNQARLMEMQYQLDVQIASKRAAKLPADAQPVVWVDPVKQDAARPYAARVVMAAPERANDAVRIMWLANPTTGQIIASKVVESASSQMGVVSGAAVQVRRLRALRPWPLHQISLCVSSRHASLAYTGRR